MTRRSLAKVWPRYKRITLRLLGFQLLIILSLYLVFFKTLNTVIEARVFPYAITMEVTAYTAGHESTGKFETHPEYGVTASTYRLNVGDGEKCIAAPPEIKFGTRIYIPGYGVGTVMDRGEAITDNRLDVYFDNVSIADEWGRKQVRVVIFP